MKKKKNRNNSTLFQNKSLFSTFALILYITAISLVLVLRINYLAREQCYTVLMSSTKEASVRIENNFTVEMKSLRVLSRVIAQEELTSNTVNELLTTFDLSSITSNIAILTADNTIVQIRGGHISDNTIIDFQEEKNRGEHLSNLQPSLASSDRNVIRCFMPIKNAGKIIGMLFLEMDPTLIATAWSPEMYDNSASFCIIDRTTGEFVINSWNDSIHNLSDLDSQELTDSIQNGATGFMEMKNSTEDIFISYMPMTLENWEIIVSVPKSHVYSSARALQQSLRLFLAAGAISLILYVVRILYTNKRSIAATEKQANIDVLTGLQNRNRYESFCQTLDDRIKEFACIYIDANGLHEINNTRGHLAGDQMLRYIADTLKVAFGEDMVYRIGGDEFVVFQRYKSEEALKAMLDKVHAEIERNDYHISSGICVCESELSINEMIKTAEKRMYEAKKRYYESIGKQVRNNINE